MACLYAREEFEMNGPPLICSIVLLFNNFTDADECIDSLVSQDYTNHMIIAVDNGSVDGSAERLQEKWQHCVTFIANGSNFGIAAGYNVGIRAGLELGAGYVVLCNNDIVADQAFIGEVYSAFLQTPNAAAIVPLMLYYDRPDVVWFGRTSMHPLFAFSRDVYRDGPLAAVSAVDATLKSDYVTTCACMLSRAALEEVGLLDERFFLGHDDVDWSLRARKRGLDLLVLTRGLVRHKVSVSQGVRGSNVLGPTAAYTNSCGAVLIGVKHFRRLAGVPFLVGLLGIRLPYNLWQMMRAHRWRSVSAYMLGIVDGLRYFASGFLEPDALGPARVIHPRTSNHR